jgi:lambda family phage portal protein
MGTALQILDHRGRPMAYHTAHEAADKTSNELASWNAGSYSPDRALIPELETLRDRTKDMIRNHGIASGAVQTHLDNIVGCGMLLDAKPDRRALGLKGEDNCCYIDASRRSRFSGLLAQAYRSYLTSFEILGTSEWVPKRGYPYKTAVQMVDPARLSNPLGERDDTKLRAGVKLDDMGAPIGYWIASQVSNDYAGMSNALRTWKLVPRETPWGRQMVMHIYDNDEPGQSRGKNGIVSVLAKMKMLEKFEHATLQAAILNAMYAAVIESSLDWPSVANAIGAGDPSTDPTLNYLSNINTFHREGNVRYNGVKIPHLFPGEKLELKSPEHPTTAFSSFTEATLRYIAAGFGLTYEQLSKDYSKTNYSSARAAMLESWQFFNGKQYHIAGRFSSMVYALWFEEAIERGELVLPSGLPDFYEAKAAWTKCNWIGPGRGHIDPLKEANATKVEMSSGLTTLQIEAAKRGRRWQDLIDQRAQEDRYARSRGVDPDQLRGITPVAQPPDTPEEPRGNQQDRQTEGAPA